MSFHFDAQFPDAAEAMQALETKSEHLVNLEQAAFDCGRALIAYSELEKLMRSAWAHGALRACGDNASLAARETHLHRNTLAKMLHSLDKGKD